MEMNALGIAVCLPLLAAANQCALPEGTPPTHEQACADASLTWIAEGLTPEQVPDTPDQLLKARLRVGESSRLQVRSFGEPCEDLVASVAWTSARPAVAAMAADGIRSGVLAARAPGETTVWSDVVLQDGTTRRAELYAVPAGRSTRQRVYGVVVVR